VHLLACIYWRAFIDVQLPMSGCLMDFKAVREDLVERKKISNNRLKSLINFQESISGKQLQADVRTG
jgi:hypothetical protein